MRWWAQSYVFFAVVAGLALAVAPQPVHAQNENKQKVRWAVNNGLKAEKMFWNDIADFGRSSDPFSV